MNVLENKLLKSAGIGLANKLSDSLVEVLMVTDKRHIPFVMKLM